MKNKCPNCGYEYGDIDSYCAMCGTKLKDIQIPDLTSNADNSSQEATLENMQSFVNDNQNANQAKKINFDGSIFDNVVFNFVLVMIVISIAMCSLLYLFIQKQNSKKMFLRYNTMVSNPALIPELKEPKNFKELNTFLKNNENFLTLYLKYSKDNPDKKNQVFISYLKEMDKLPHITSDTVAKNEIDICAKITSSLTAKKCINEYINDFKDVGIMAYYDSNAIYLYPDYKFIYKKYKHLTTDTIHKYLKLKAKYNEPASIGVQINMKPKKIADKISEFEKLYTTIADVYIRDEVLKTIYNDFRTFIFSPSIYNTTTQEMKKEFKNAYRYFIAHKKNSQLRPTVMSYMDKMRSYSEENFKNDYPYKVFVESFSENAESSTFNDIFAKLRKSIFTSGEKIGFSYVYNIAHSSWKKFEKGANLTQGEYVFATPDENNNVSIFNNTYSLVQEMSIPKYNKLFISNNALYAFNSDRLNLSKVVFNGKIFVLQNMNIYDASGAFPGIEVINIDSFQNYNIYVEKDNAHAVYIILSRYSQGFDGYKVSSVNGGKVSMQSLPNAFSISSTDDAELAFHHESVNPKETSENNPTYKIKIHTVSSKPAKSEVVQFDEATSKQPEDDIEKHNPNIMPKILLENIEKIKDNKDENELLTPPKQNIEPPGDD